MVMNERMVDERDDAVAHRPIGHGLQHAARSRTVDSTREAWPRRVVGNRAAGRWFDLAFLLAAPFPPLVVLLEGQVFLQLFLSDHPGDVELCLLRHHGSPFLPSNPSLDSNTGDAVVSAELPEHRRGGDDVRPPAGCRRLL